MRITPFEHLGVGEVGPRKFGEVGVLNLCQIPPAFGVTLRSRMDGRVCKCKPPGAKQHFEFRQHARGLRLPAPVG